MLRETEENGKRKLKDLRVCLQGSSCGAEAARCMWTVLREKTALYIPFGWFPASIALSDLSFLLQVPHTSVQVAADCSKAVPGILRTVIDSSAQWLKDTDASPWTSLVADVEAFSEKVGDDKDADDEKPKDPADDEKPKDPADDEKAEDPGGDEKLTDPADDEKPEDPAEQVAEKDGEN